ncbi:MAG: 50S ribosomal protein L6 [Candidatus Asgardarchaeia archaeon]
MGKTPIAYKEVEIPDGITINIEGKKVTVSGPKGELSKDFSHTVVNLRKSDNKVIVEYLFPTRREKAQVGTVAAHIKNMIKGVSEGFIYKMKMVYSHFPFTVKVEGKNVVIENFLGERAPRVAKIVGNTKVTVKGDDVIIEGIDIEAVGQTAANIQLATKIKDKDPRVFMDGIYVYEKGGKRLVG